MCIDKLSQSCVLDVTCKMESLRGASWDSSWNLYDSGKITHVMQQKLKLMNDVGWFMIAYQFCSRTLRFTRDMICRTRGVILAWLIFFLSNILSLTSQDSICWKKIPAAPLTSQKRWGHHRIKSTHTRKLISKKKSYHIVTETEMQNSRQSSDWFLPEEQMRRVSFARSLLWPDSEP